MEKEKSMSNGAAIKEKEFSHNLYIFFVDRAEQDVSEFVAVSKTQFDIDLSMKL